jgi:hypothetical protein
MSDEKPTSGFLELDALMKKGGLDSQFLSWWTCPCCGTPMIIGLSICLVKRNSDGELFWRLGVAAASAEKRDPCKTRDEMNRLLGESDVWNLRASWKQVGTFITTEEDLAKDAAYTLLPRMTIEQFKDYLRLNSGPKEDYIYGVLFEDTIVATLQPFMEKKTELLTGMRSD